MAKDSDSGVAFVKCNSGNITGDHKPSIAAGNVGNDVWRAHVCVCVCGTSFDRVELWGTFHRLYFSLTALARKGISAVVVNLSQDARVKQMVQYVKLS